MFASQKLENLEYKRTSAEKSTLSKIVDIHNKLKLIASIEAKSKVEYRVAKLSNNKLNEIKRVEEELDLSLVAYERNENALSQRKQILNEVQQMLDKYLELSCKKSSAEYDFKDFFEQ